MKKHAHHAAPGAIQLALDERGVGEAVLPGWHYFILSLLHLGQRRLNVCGWRLVVLEVIHRRGLAVLLDVVHFRRFKVLYVLHVRLNVVHNGQFMLFDVIRLFNVVYGWRLKIILITNGWSMEDERSCRLVPDMVFSRRLEAYENLPV
jgi:hypothetical protein